MLLAVQDARAASAVRALLTGAHHEIIPATTGSDVARLLATQRIDVALIGDRLAGLDALDGVALVRQLDPHCQIILLVHPGSEYSAAEGIRLGAYEYVDARDLDERLPALVDRAATEAARRRATQGATEGAPGGIVGRSRAMERVFHLIDRVAHTRSTVLISGETGTGKELIARRIHDVSDRAQRPFIPVNCSALPDTLLESELFGYVKGSFTGATGNREGLFEAARGGTVFLDEIALISHATQVKLLRVLQERTVRRVGDPHPRAVDFRLVAATNVSLGDEVRAGRFREDLYYRLNVFPITAPPLRERKGDIPLLIEWFRKRFARDNAFDPPQVAPLTLARMLEYDWPGNVRELEHYLERAFTTFAGDPFIPFIPPAADDGQPQRDLLARAFDGQWPLRRLEHEYMLDVIQATATRQAAASWLGVSRRTLERKLGHMRRRGAPG
ncbi:MAG TPA: sigma-54 dependent transcriptional regulator [Gemmatimonadaceae bacterium]